MESQLQDKLQKAGVSPAAIAILIAEELETEEKLQGFTYDQFIQMKIKAGSAKILASMYAPKADATAPATAAPGGNISVIVQSKVALAEMEMSELLERLMGNPTDDAALDELFGREQFQVVYAKDPRVAVIDSPSNTLNITATLKYWQYLRKGAPQTRWDSKRVVTIEKALGRVERLLLHPIVAQETIYMGTDKFGCDWTKVSADRMEAAYWARTTRHAQFPQVADPMDVYEALCEENLSTRWQTILEDYLAQIDENGRVNLLTTQGGAGSAAAPFRTRLEV